MVRLLALGVALLASQALPAAEVYPLAGGDLPNKLANPGFDDGLAGRSVGWNAYEGGYVLDPGQGRGGSTAVRCRRTAAADPQLGVSTSLTLDQPRPMPLVVTGWSRADGVEGGADPDYSLYCDLHYTDGTPLWGQSTSFEVGTHGWQQARVVIFPEKPVKDLRVYGLFRHHTGTVWFDDFALGQDESTAGTARLDSLAVKAAAPERKGGTAVGAATLRVAFDGSGVGGITLAGTDILGAHEGGFLVRDVAANSGWHGFVNGRCDALGLRLEAAPTSRGTHLEVAGRLTDTTGQPRAVTLLFALPLATAKLGWAAMGRTSAATESSEWADLAGVEVGTGKLSRWPFATAVTPAGAISLGVHPAAPLQYRLGLSSALGLLYVACDLGLTPQTVQFPSAAPFRFVMFGSRGDWGFRAALEAWYACFPDFYQVRIPDQGIWMAFARTSHVKDWQDFGFRIKEGDDETAWDDAHHVLTFRYSEMGTYWMPMKPEVPRTYEEAFKILQAQAADPTNKDAWRLANAVLSSGSQDSQGKYQLRFENAPWCNGCVWSLNPSPYLSGEVTQAKLSWGPERQKSYEPGAKPELDGEYLDSLEGYVTAALNYRPEHLAACRIPPTFDRNNRPVVYKAFSITEFLSNLGDDLHRRGRLMMANGVPYRFGFMMPWFDTTGTETDWGQDGKYTPDDDGLMELRRALSGQKPYLLLMNTRFEPFGPYVERYFQRALAFGMYPSMFSHNAAEDHYFDHPEWYDRDRALFRKYIPLIKQVAEEGWQPVTLARCDNPAVHLERFGPGRTKRIYFTLHNPTAEAVTGRVTFDPRQLGRNVPDGVVTLAPYATEVVTLK